MRKFVIATMVDLTSTATLADDRFEIIRDKWVQCAACHGPEGQGGIGPTLAGQSADDIIDKLMAYKRGETVGAQSALMCPQA